MVLSSDLKAFYEFYQGFREETLKRYPGRELRVLILTETPFIKAEIARFKPQTIIAVGPAAAKALKPLTPEKQFFPALVLKTDHKCGLFLIPPPETEAQQLIAGLRRIFPKGKLKLIIPCKNCDEAKELKNFFPEDITMVTHPIKENFPNDLLNIFKTPYRIIYIRPESFLNTTTIAKILVKQALYNKKILFGFSSYFCRIGAAICFEHDYNAAGKIAANIDFEKLRNQKNCEFFVPIKIKINQKVLKKILENDS